MGKVRLFIRSRKQGSYVASVPLKPLVKLATCRKRFWVLKEWLVDS